VTVESSSATIVAQLPSAPSVHEPWLPKVGDYVRVDRSPECQALHAHIPPGVGPVYGRVEMVDRTWDDPATWITAGVEDGCDLADMLESARTSSGHYYYVSDGLVGERYLLIDGQHAASELTLVPELEARIAIEQLREFMASMTRTERMLARIGLKVQS
jgi:hypothetical protein